MKKKNLSKALTLNKETIAGLGDMEKDQVRGGAIITKTGCPTEWPCGSDYWGCNTNFLICHPR